MSFIGNIPAEAFSATVKDTLSGNGSDTDFPLSVPATTNSVEVFVENVQQEPTTAYTISGTTLSFTAPPVTGTDNIYVIHRGPAVQTVVPPSGIALSATTVTATGVVTATGDISTEGDLKVEVSSGGIYTITGTDTATNRTLTLPDEAGTVLTNTGLQSDKMVDVWYCDTGATMSGTSCRLGFTDSTTVAQDSADSGFIGSSRMTQTNGNFSFPRTGIYKIIFVCTQESDASDTRVYATIDLTTNDSTYNIVSEGNGFSTAGSQYFTMQCNYIADIENVSTHKVQFLARGATGADVVAGRVRTYMIFERLGDT